MIPDPITTYDGDVPDWRVLVDRFYGDNPDARDILVEHSEAVAGLAADINVRRGLHLPGPVVHYAAMLHDIGIFLTNAPGIGCHGTLPYIQHGVAGADLLRDCGAPEWAARVAERHTGSGLTDSDIAAQGLDLPPGRCMMPHSELEQLVCYADKFFSKRPGYLSVQKTLDKVRSEMSRHGDASLARFEVLHRRFG